MINRLLVLLAAAIVIAFSNASAYAAGPVAHAYLAERFFEYYPNYSDAEKKSFLIGTLFPDIRYLGQIKRQDTHFKDVTIQTVLNEPSPFIAGMIFHSYVDEQRNIYVRNSNIYSSIPLEVKTKHRPLFLKIVEDQLIYGKASWDYVAQYLESIDPEELGRGVDESNINKWHGLLMLIFKSSPETAIKLLGFIDHGLSHISGGDLRCCINLLGPTVESPVMQSYTQGMLDHFDELFKNK